MTTQTQAAPGRTPACRRLERDLRSMLRLPACAGPLVRERWFPHGGDVG